MYNLGDKYMFAFAWSLYCTPQSLNGSDAEPLYMARLFNKGESVIIDYDK